MRLIDADALEKEMCSGCKYNKNKYANCDDCAIANAPTIDAVQVVRCTDCRYRYDVTCPMYYEEWFTIDEGDGWCDRDFRIIDDTQDDGFCYCGERGEP